MTDTKSVFRFLNDHAVRPDDMPDRPEPGVYAIFAARPECLPGIVLPRSGLVYIGESGNLAGRNHFRMANSGFSSLRRSLGALLKSQLRLKVEPQPSGRSEKSYRFANDSEERLTAWMQRNLKCASYPFNGERKNLEKRLIKENKPPLNLKHWGIIRQTSQQIGIDLNSDQRSQAAPPTSSSRTTLR